MTDKQRQAYEEWLRTDTSDPADVGFAIWTASRKLALEEAAQIADKQSGLYADKMAAAQRWNGLEERWERFYNYKDAADYIAAAIRQQQGQKHE